MYFLTPWQSILRQDTFGQSLSCTIKYKYPISAHCCLRRLIVLTDLTAHFTIRTMFKWLASMRRSDRFLVVCQGCLALGRIEHELFSHWAYCFWERWQWIQHYSTSSESFKRKRYMKVCKNFFLAFIFKQKPLSFMTLLNLEYSFYLPPRRYVSLYCNG